MPVWIKKRTTTEARAVDSSQLLGNCEPEIGTLSVWPSTMIGCVLSMFSAWATPVSTGAAAGLRMA